MRKRESARLTFAKLGAAAILAATVFNPGASSADVLVLRDGTRLEGRVEAVANSTDRVAITTGTGRLELPLSRIAETIDESDALDYTRLGKYFSENKQYTTAVQNFQMALEADPSLAAARDGLAEAQSAIEAQQTENQEKAQERLSNELGEIRKIVDQDVYDEQTYKDAEKALNRLVESAGSSQAGLEAQRLLRDLYISWGFERLDRLDKKGAEEKYLRVLEIEPENREAREKLLKIWQDDPTKRQEVLSAYLAKLKEEPSNLEYNKVVGDMYYEMRDYESAIGPLKKVQASPTYASAGYTDRLKRAYDQSISRARDAGNTQKAVDLFRDMLIIYPNEDTTDLAVLQYQLERDKLAQDDWEGRARLVQRLQDIGLTQLARTEAELIVRYDPENKIAVDILRGQAQQDLNDINEAYATGKYLVSVGMADNFIQNHTRFPDMIVQVEEVRNRAEIQAKQAAEDARKQAVSIAQQGERYYAEAQRAVALLNDREIDSSARPISYKQEATRYAKRAIEHYQTALKIDPSLGPITGMDLNTKLADAQRMYNGLTRRPLPVPTPRNR